MEKSDFDGMSVDALWAMYERVSGKLEAKLVAEKKILEGRLAALTSFDDGHHARKQERRPYPRVFPKFRNPDDPSQTWAGRGKQPRWFKTQLKSGCRMNDLRIQQAAE